MLRDAIESIRAAKASAIAHPRLRDFSLQKRLFVHAMIDIFMAIDVKKHGYITVGGQWKSRVKNHIKS